MVSLRCGGYYSQRARSAGNFVGGKDQTQKVLTDLLVREELNAAGRLRQQVFTAEFLKELIRVSATKEALLLSAFLDHTMNMLIEATTGERQPGTRR